MKIANKFPFLVFIILSCLITSCEDYLDIEAPNNKITSEIVFNSDETAKSVMKGIYNQLFNSPFSSGGPASITVLSGLSGDIVAPIRPTNLTYVEFDQHEILPDNSRNLGLWSSAYNIVYMCNSLLEGLEDSQGISEGVNQQLKGEALFVRSFTYFYLMNLFGDVPLILSTDYEINALASKESKENIYEQITVDLQTSIDILMPGFVDGERTNVNQNTAIALLARIKLYNENWEEAESLSSQVISQSETYEILENLDEVFLANSKEAIWQLSPAGSGGVLTNTNEGAGFLIHPFLSFLANLKIEPPFVKSMDTIDLRLQNWIGFNSGLEVYYANKYKIRNSTEPITEYSMVMRLAEQYLIRAEARFKLGDIEGAIADLNKIRNRAGLESVIENSDDLPNSDLLDLIMEERKRELFAEWGHRWLDLKRTSTAEEILGVENSQWKNTDVLYPIPASELLKNPNITQNDGY